MDEKLKTYLEYRFRKNNCNKYLKYCDEWVNNVMNNLCAYNINYFIMEAEHLNY